MSDSKSGSKDNLNESNMPLLSNQAEEEKAGDTPEKEVQEMELEEKTDDTTEKGDDPADAKKVKKEKKEKKKKEKKEPGPSCIEVHSAGLDLANRDGSEINDEVNIEFSSVFAEPAASHGFECVWKLNYVMFNQTKMWIYKILTALISVPMAILWALVFSLVTVLYVWLVKPILALFTVVMNVFKKVWTTLVDSTLTPVCTSVGQIFAYRAIPQGLVQNA